MPCPVRYSSLTSRNHAVDSRGSIRRPSCSRRCSSRSRSQPRIHRDRRSRDSRRRRRRAVVLLLVAFVAAVAVAAIVAFLRVRRKNRLVVRCCSQEFVRPAPVVIDSDRWSRRPPIIRVPAPVRVARKVPRASRMSPMLPSSRAHKSTSGLRALSMSPEVDRTLAILPRHTPPPAHHAIDRVAAHPSPPNPAPGSAGIDTLLAAFNRIAGDR